MIDVREVVRGLRLPPDDEREVQRIGAEIAGALRDPSRFDGRPISFEIPAGEGDEQQVRSYRIACALQRRFGAKGWFVNGDTVQGAFGETVAHRLTVAIDPAALREPLITPKIEEGDPKRWILGRVQAVSEKPVISVLLGTYNRLSILEKMIASVRSSVGDLSYEIVVCDGGSTDATRAWLALQPDVILIGERRLDGAVKAFNQAYALSRGEFIANLNDDCVVHGRALADGVEHLRKNPRCGQVAFSFSGAGQPKRGINDIWGEGSPRPVPWGTTYANFGVARCEATEQVVKIQGGFWNPCYRTYAGDCELSAWLWKLGWTVDKRPDLYVEDVWAEDDLRAKNAVGSGDEARRMYERWNDPEMFKPDGPMPNVSAEEIVRFYEVSAGRNGNDVDVAQTAQRQGQGLGSQPEGPATVLRSLQALPFPEPQEERRLVALAPHIRALDPVDGQFPPRAEKLLAERVLHVGLCTDADPQAGLVKVLKNISYTRWAKEGSAGGENEESAYYREVRWFADYKDDAEARQSAILKAAFEQKPTLVFMQVMQGAFDPSFVKKLREVADPSCVIVTWSGDVAYDHSPWNLDGHVALGRSVDVMLHSSFTHVRILRAAGVHNAGYLQIGYDPEQYRMPLRAPGSLGQVAASGALSAADLAAVADDAAAVAYGDWRAKFRSYDVAFLGSHYGGEDAFSQSVKRHDGVLRDEVVAKMKEKFGWKFQLYGKGWGKVREMPLHRAHEIYQRAKVGLSVNLMNDLDCYTSDRAHRILGCGTLLLVKRFPMMSVLGLETGVNCIAWSTADEAVEAAKLCLDEKTDSIRRAGAELAREHWTWEIRMRELAKYVEAVRGARG